MANDMGTPHNKSVIKSFKIIEVFQLHRQALTLSQIAAEAHTSVAAAHRLVSTMQSIGILRTDSTGRYLLGPKLAEIGEQASQIASPRKTLNEIISALSTTVNETVHVGMLRGDMVRYVAKAESSRSAPIVTRTGIELEAYCTGVGKVLLASAGDKVVDRYLRSGEFVQLTKNTLTSRMQLRREFAEVRANGFAVDAEEFENGLKCIAVPILTDCGQVIASMSISGPTGRIDRSSVPQFVDQLRKYAYLITERVNVEEWKYM